MKRFFCILLSLMLFISVTACGSKGNEKDSGTELKKNTAVSEIQEKSRTEEHSVTGTGLETETEQEENKMRMNIQIGEHMLTATFAQNSSTEALVAMLSEGPVTIHMNDYANMEKVGPLPEGLPRNDEQIRTDAGDLILYQGNFFVIYYDTNSWNFTRLGKIDDISKQELKEILGSGSVTAILSLPSNAKPEEKENI